MSTEIPDIFEELKNQRLQKKKTLKQISQSTWTFDSTLDFAQDSLREGKFAVRPTQIRGSKQVLWENINVF